MNDCENFTFAMNPSQSTKKKYRVALAAYFAAAGLCMGTWTSRIPTIKTLFYLNEAELGNLLLIMPIASVVGIPLSSWVVARFESRKPIFWSFLLNVLTMVMIGFSHTLWMLQLSIFLFAFTLRVLNVAINTQSLKVQEIFSKRIVGGFHAFWSLGSVIGVGVSTLMVKFEVPIDSHFLVIAFFSVAASLGAYGFLIRNDQSAYGNRFVFSRPDTFLLSLGIIIFSAALLEGGMFDWSGVYFREVLDEEVFTLGYLAFMVSMSFSRFFSDALVQRLGAHRTYMVSGLFIIMGMSLAILFPTFWSAFIGFGLVGFGTSSLFPLTYSLAGRSKKYSAGISISIVTTYSIFGFLAGPAVIGHLAHLLGLQKAFVLLALTGVMVILVSRFLTREGEMQED